MQRPPYTNDNPESTEQTYDAGYPAEQRSMRDYALAVYRRRWLVVAIFAIVFGVATVNSFRTVPVYEASAQLLIDTGKRNVLKFEDVVEQDRSSFDFAETQYRLLRSRALVARTLTALGMWDRPVAPTSDAAAPQSFSAMTTLKAPLRWLSQTLTPPSPVSESPATNETRAQSSSIDSMLGGITVSPIRNSQLVDVKYRSPDPALAARVANELVKQYISQAEDQRLEASRDASGWLGDQLEEQRKQLQASELALQQYRERNDSVSLEGNDNIVVQKLADLNTAVTRAKLDRIQKESVFRQLENLESSSDTLDTFPVILSNTFVQQLKSELSQLVSERTQLGEKLGEKHPSMVKLTSAIESAKAKLDLEIGKVVRSVQNEYLAAVTQEQSLTTALNAQKVDAQSQNRKGIDLASLQRDVTTNRELYAGLLQRSKETGISSELTAANVRIVDPAEVPRSPVLPQRQRDLMVGFIAACVLAVGAALGLNALDNRLKTPEELTAHLGLPCLGLVPMINDRKRDKAPLLEHDVPANFGEAFKALRTNVLFASADEGPRSLVVTSTIPGEGKTVVATNLAISLAQAGQRVLLIDADMRRPKAHDLLEQSQEPGLSNLIVGNTKASDAVRPTSVRGLWVLPAGRLPPNPAELLGSTRFRDFLVTLRDHFDWVILDSPPVMAVTDASVVAHLADGVVFVVGAEMANRGAARTAVHQIQTANGKVVGAVLNLVNLKQHGYYYSNYYRREYGAYHVAAS